MAFFFFLSGLVSSKCNWKTVSKMAGRLMVPFIAWFILRALVGNGFDFGKVTQDFIELLKRPDRGLWFLLILFEAYFVLWLINLLKKSLGFYAFLLGL